MLGLLHQEKIRVFICPLLQKTICIYSSPSMLWNFSPTLNENSSILTRYPRKIWKIRTTMVTNRIIFEQLKDFDLMLFHSGTLPWRCCNDPHFQKGLCLLKGSNENLLQLRNFICEFYSNFYDELDLLALFLWRYYADLFRHWKCFASSERLPNKFCASSQN